MKLDATVSSFIAHWKRWLCLCENMLTCGQRAELFEADDLIYALLLSALHRWTWRNVGIEHNAQHVEKIIKNAAQDKCWRKLAAGVHNTKRIAICDGYFKRDTIYTLCININRLYIVTWSHHGFRRSGHGNARLQIWSMSSSELYGVVLDLPKNASIIKHRFGRRTVKRISTECG